MRLYNRPPKEVDVKLPSSFSSNQFITELLNSLPSDGSFAYAYLLENILSKYCDPSTTAPAARREAAIEKWLSAERRNAMTNDRIFHANARELDLGWIEFPDLISRIQSFVSRILGVLEYPVILHDLVPSNGASTRVKRSETAALHKLMGTAHISADALKHWLATASGTMLAEQNLVIQDSSELFTVPKNSVIDRVACKEPEVNMLMQRSVGQHIRRRLKKFGIDLLDQTINQRLAKVASSTGLATIDLSSASDTISAELVKACLPPDWFDVLDDLRVKKTVIDGVEHDLSMFSSMGNGFTFELESLLFFAITSVVCRASKVHGRISVYGDDIIAPCAIVPRLIRVFHLLGFKTNAAKTFWTGDFRESCGKHYHRGFDVSPFFIRGKVSTLDELMNTLNQYMEWNCRNIGFFVEPEVLQFHSKWALAYVPPYLWGGQDTQDNSRLVTGHLPRYALTKRYKPAEFSAEAALCLWYMARENTEEPLSIEPKRAIGYRAKRALSWWTGSWKPWLLAADMAVHIPADMRKARGPGAGQQPRNRR